MITYLSRQLSEGAWPHQATITLHQPAEAVADRIWPGMGALEALDQHRSRLHLGAETPADLAWMVAVIGVDFTLTEGPPELTDALQALSTRCARAVQGAT